MLLRAFCFVLLNGVESTQNRVLYTSYFYCPVATATVTASEAVWHFYRTIHHLDTCFFQQNFYDYSSWNVCVCAFTAIFYYALLLFRLFWCTNLRMLANILMTMLSILWKVLFCVCDSGAQNVVQKTSNDKSLDLSTLVSITNEHTQSESLNGIANTKYSPFFFLWTPQMKWEKRKRSQRVECLALFWEIFIS